MVSLHIAVAGQLFISIPAENAKIELTDKEKHELQSSDHGIINNKLISDLHNVHSHTHTEDGEEHNHKHSHSSNSTCIDHLINKSTDTILTSYAKNENTSISFQSMNIKTFMADILLT